MTPTPEAVEQLWPVIWRIAKAMARRARGYWTQEELASFGYDGAVGGLRTYNSAYGRSLEDHCARRIKGAMLDGMSVKGWHFIPRAARKPATRTTPRDVTTASIDARDHANAILDGLSERHAWILGAYYLDGWTQEQIGRVLGISGSAVSQSMKTALRRLRRAHG